MRLIPVGERCLVEEAEVVDSDAKAWEQAGLVLVEYESHETKPTHGIVVAVGAGPLIRETVKVGDTVFFAQYAGTYTTVEDKRFRNLEVQEITSVLREVED